MGRAFLIVEQFLRDGRMSAEFAQLLLANELSAGGVPAIYRDAFEPTALDRVVLDENASGPDRDNTFDCHECIADLGEDLREVPDMDELAALDVDQFTGEPIADSAEFFVAGERSLPDVEHFIAEGEGLGELILGAMFNNDEADDGALITDGEGDVSC